MARIPAGAKDTVPAEFRDAFDQAVSRIGGPVSGGPWPMMLNSPELALRRIHLADYLRKESTFSKKIQELAILIAVRAMDCQYAWMAHAATARREGVNDALVDAIRDKMPLPAMTPEEKALVDYGQEFYSTHKVSPATFQSALDQFGAQHLVELTMLMGHYAQTSFILNAFDVTLPEQHPEPLLPV
jgi:4-carboxymuconolactone decarboxylase